MILEKSHQVSKNCTSTFGAYNLDWILLRSTCLFFNFSSTLSHDLQWSVFSPEECFNSQALKISWSYSYSKFWIELVPERERFIKSCCFSRYLLNIYNLIFIWSNYDSQNNWLSSSSQPAFTCSNLKKETPSCLKRQSFIWINRSDQGSSF